MHAEDRHTCIDSTASLLVAPCAVVVHVLSSWYTCIDSTAILLHCFGAVLCQDDDLVRAREEVCCELH